MKILTLNTQMEAGGAQKAMLELATGLRRRGHDVTVVTMYDKTNYIPIFEARYDMPIINLNMKGEGSQLNRLLNPAKGLWKLRQLLRERNIEVLQTFSHFSNITGPIVGWLAGVPVRISSQRMPLKGKSVWIRRADRWVVSSPLVQQMTMVSEGTRQYCLHEQGLPDHKIMTLPNGIAVEKYGREMPSNNVRQELNLPPNALVVTTVARLHPQKNHLVYLDAVAQVAKSVPNAHFLFAGDGALQGEIATKINKLGLNNCVHMLGMRADVPALLAASDLFVLPSLWEGMPNSILEAMASGLAVVATNIEGTDEVVKNGETGLLVPTDDPIAIANAITTLLTDTRQRQKMGQSGFAVAQEFSLEKAISRYETLYQSYL